MADMTRIKGRIQEVIRPNGVGAITAAEHQSLLLEMVDDINSKKADKAELAELEEDKVSHDDLATINGKRIDAGGNIEIEGGMSEEEKAELNEKLTELSAKVGIFQDTHVGDSIIFTKDEIPAGNIINVKLRLLVVSGMVVVVDNAGAYVKTFLFQGEVGQEKEFEPYVLPENYDKVMSLGAYSGNQYGGLDVSIIVDGITNVSMSQKISENTQKIEKIGMEIVHTISGKYITTGGSIVAASGDVGIFVFEVPQAAFLLQIPKTGNQYHTLYAFNDAIVDSGTLKDAQGVGTESVAEIELDGRVLQYKYIYVSCRPSAGIPLMYIKSPYSFEFKDRSVPASKLQLFDTYPVCLTSAITDMNAVMDEIYLLPEYSSLADVVFKIRPYSRGFILGAYRGVGNRLWGVRVYEIKDKYKSGDLIPLVVDVTTSSTTTGTLVGYAVVKDVDALAALPSTTTEGETINIEKSSMLFLNPKISTLLSLPTQEGSESDNGLSLANGVEITLPSEITAIVGDNMQIFWRSIVSAANPYIFDIYAASSVGKSYPRYFEFKPTSDMSGKSYQMAVYVRANDGSVVAEKTISIKVISAMSAPSATKNVLCVGASATAGGQWVGELARRLTATSGDGTNANPTGLGLKNISFVGRKQGTGNPVNLEATGGWRVQDYASQGQNAVRFYVTNVDTLSLGARYLCNGVIYVIQEVNVTEGVGNIRCTLENTFVAPSGKLVKQSGSGDAEITFTSYEQEKFNPFWNDAESRLDFSSYANEYCDGHIDCMIWHCGVNDLSGASIGTMMSVIENITTSYRDIFRAYHQQFPNGKVVVSSVPVGSTNGGFAANYGSSAYSNYFTFAKKVQAYAKALSDLCEESEFANYVIYSPVLEEFDAENGYPTKQTAVNNRSSVTEAVGTNGVHPTTEGSYMVADAIYRTFNNLDL